MFSLTRCVIALQRAFLCFFDTFYRDTSGMTCFSTSLTPTATTESSTGRFLSSRARESTSIFASDETFLS